MNNTCDICNRACENKVYSSVGGQHVCSIKCASSVTPNNRDRCANCGSVVWEDENYNVNGDLCCCQMCRDALRSKNNNGSYTQNSSKKVTNTKKETFNIEDNYFEPKRNKFEVKPGMQV